MNIGWPQVILLALMFLGLGQGLAEHGKPKAPTTGEHSAWGDVFAAVLVLGLLSWGGFFG